MEPSTSELAAHRRIVDCIFDNVDEMLQVPEVLREEVGKLICPIKKCCGESSETKKSEKITIVKMNLDNIDMNMAVSQTKQVLAENNNENNINNNNNDKLSFCQRLSSVELSELQRATENEGLEKLLQSLAMSRTLKLEEKRKKLLQFEQTHPAIFRRLFPTREHLEVILEKQKNRTFSGGKEEKGAATVLQHTKGKEGEEKKKRRSWKPSFFRF